MKNPQVKRAYSEEEYTPSDILELKRCMTDPIYFMEKYLVVNHPTKGLVPFVMYEYQKKMVHAVHNNKDVIILASRQLGKTTVIAMYILWFALFNNDKTCVIASKTMDHAVEIMSRIKTGYEELPNWIKAGCKFFNLTRIEFDNGSKIKCEATTEKTGRGGSPSILMIDEISFINPRVQQKMWASITPSLSTGGKFVLTSTPNGDSDLFATIWRGAMGGTNSFLPLQAMWYEHPDRGQEYYNEMLGKLGPLVTRQEIDCVHGDSILTVLDTYSNNIRNLKFEDLTKELLHDHFLQNPLQDDLDSRKWQNTKRRERKIIRDSSQGWKSSERFFGKLGMSEYSGSFRMPHPNERSFWCNDDSEENGKNFRRIISHPTWGKDIGRNKIHQRDDAMCVSNPEKQNLEIHFVKNTRFKLLSPSGFQMFCGVRVSFASKTLKIQTSNTSIRCTLRHKFNNVIASELLIGDYLETSLGREEIISIEVLDDSVRVYDPVEVQGGHLYITNNIVNHNCEFLSSDALLINSLKLHQIKSKPVLYEDMGFKFWVPQDQLGGQGKTYMVSIDPATGSGSDFSVIEVFDFPKLNQVAEWRSNEINIPLLYAKVKWILNLLSARIGSGRSEVIWTFERNGIGEAMCALFVNDEKQPEHAELFCDTPGKFGVYTTGKSKILACLQTKQLVEKTTSGFTINSETLLFELKNFIAKGGTYEAKTGATDDCVSAVIGITRLLKRLSEYNDAAFKAVNEYVDADSDSSDDEPMPFFVL
jgi:hypothetical protein